MRLASLTGTTSRIKGAVFTNPRDQTIKGMLSGYHRWFQTASKKGLAMKAQALASLVARSTSFGRFLSAHSLSRALRLMSMAALLTVLIASSVHALTEDKKLQKHLLDASRKFVEMSKELSADGAISAQERQQIRPLIIKLKKIVHALPCGSAYWYYDLAGKQMLYKGPAPECRLITTKSGGLPWNAAAFSVPPDDESTATVTGPAAEPVVFSLYANYPNPFNAETQIVYTLSEAGPVELAIYNVRGQRVRTLVQGVQAAGRYQIVWNGRSDSGAALASGVYLYRLASAQGVRVRRLALLK